MSTCRRRSFELFLLGPKALPAVFDIAGEDLSSRRLPFRKMRDRCSRGDAEGKVDVIFFDGRCVAASVSSGGRREPRGPASGLARLIAHAGLTSGSCLELQHALCACVVASGARSVGAELRACAEWDDKSTRKSPRVEVRARAIAWTPCCTAHAQRDV